MPLMCPLNLCRNGRNLVFAMITLTQLESHIKGKPTPVAHPLGKLVTFSLQWHRVVSHKQALKDCQMILESKYSIQIYRFKSSDNKAISLTSQIQKLPNQNSRRRWWPLRLNCKGRRQRPGQQGSDRWVSQGDQGQSILGAMYWESHSMNHLTWPIDCKSVYSVLAKARDHWLTRVQQH